MKDQIELEAAKFDNAKPQVRYSQHTIQFAMSVLSRSAGAFQVVSQTVNLPCKRTLLNRRDAIPLTSGNCYGFYHSAQMANDGESDDGILITDEMKLVASLLFNASNNMIIGLVNCHLDLEEFFDEHFSSLFPEVSEPAVFSATPSATSSSAPSPPLVKISSPKQSSSYKVEKTGNRFAAEYVSQWLWKSNSCKKHEGSTASPILRVFPCEHFYSNKPHSADELLQQFMSVLSKCEATGFKVHGFVSDGGISNATLWKFVREFDNCTSTNADVATYTDEYVSFVHPFSPSRRIYFWHCSAHGKF